MNKTTNNNESESEVSMKKYELTDRKRDVDGRTLHQIRAVRDFGDIKEGEFGGWIESEDNLSHRGDCWVYTNALVYDEAIVSGDAQVHSNARVFDCAKMDGKTEASGNSHVFGNAEMHDYSVIKGNARIFGCAKMIENAFADGNAIIDGNVILSEDDWIFGEEEIYGDLEFDDVISGLKHGKKYKRSGWWNNKCIYLVEGSTFNVNRAPLNKLLPEGTKVNYRPHIDVIYPDGTFGVWNPDHSDLLADDWSEVLDLDDLIDER